MLQLIENPRRAPRAPVRCEARIALEDGGFWAAPTTDCGPHGCQVVSPLPLQPGSRVYVQLANERVPGAVEIAGRVAWTTHDSPWRLGVAFEPGSFHAAGAFFERLAAAYPGMDTYGRAPDRIPADAPLAPARPPSIPPLLTTSEATLLHGIGEGSRAGVLEVLFPEDLEMGVHALFSLLGRRYVVIGGPNPGAASAWAALRSRGAIT